MTPGRPLLPYFVVPALPLLVPLVAMHYTREVQWTASDFVVAYILLAGAGFAYRVVTIRAGSAAYRIAAGLAVFAGLSLVWVNLAVGFIGDEGNPANLLYLGVLAICVLGSILARFEPRGMACTLFAAGAAQFLVPVVAWLVWRTGFDADVGLIFLLNGLWVLMFAGSGLLFRRCARVAEAAGLGRS